VQIVIDALKSARRIVVLGDYDVDGITGTTLLLEFFEACGCKNLDFFIPNRLEHGYGLTAKSAEVLLSMNPEVVITVDNGITAAAEVEQLQASGITTVITDHHLPGAELPGGIVVNPNHPECPYPFKKLSGCGVALKLALGVRKVLREQGWWTTDRPEPNLLDSMDLAALGTIADVVPLVDENRIMVQFGLQVMNSKPRLGVTAMRSLRKTDKVVARTVGFQFAPLLNASGRLKDASLGVELLRCQDDESARMIVAELNRINEERRSVEAEMRDAAFRIAATQRDRHSLVIAHPEFHEGVNGIVAARLVEHYHKPTIILSQNGDSLKGSARSIPELHVKQALESCTDLLDRFGGHAAAAGCALSLDRLNAFSARFEAFCRAALPELPTPKLQIDGTLDESVVSDQLVEQLEWLQPFGESNPEPIFVVQAPEQEFQTMKDRHVKWQLNGSVEIVGWNFAEAFEQQPPLQLAVTLGFNEFRGRRRVQMLIQEVQV
jgi:single-stranded-DNA-specific exonuclease